MKVRMGILNMNGRASIWWKNFKKVKKISERKITQKQFKNTFNKNNFKKGTMITRLNNSMR
jgi:hypothetical protein